VAPSGECLRGYKPGAADCSRLAPSCGSFLPVLNPVVIPGLRAGTCCVVLCGSWLTVSKCICHLCNKEWLYFTLFVERVFSKSGLIIRPHRAKMLDKLFESLVFAKCSIFSWLLWSWAVCMANFVIIVIFWVFGIHFGQLSLITTTYPFTHKVTKCS